MIIRTPRLIIRDYHLSDWSDLYEIFSSEHVMRACEPTYTEDQTKKALSYFIEKSIAYAVTLADSGKVIGHALFAQLPPPDEQGIYEIGWIYNEKYWRNGYAFEASKALIDYGFKNLKIHKVIAETTDPVKSVRLMEKLGMRHEGTFRAHTKDRNGNWTDLYWYAIVNPEEEINDLYNY